MALSHGKRTANFLLIILFLALIFVSPLNMFSNEQKRWNEAEKRNLALLPSIPQSLSELASFSSSVDDYLEDHFGYREFYIRRYQRELDKRFNKAGLNSKVITGLNGWYFFNAFDLLKDFQGKIPLTPTQLNDWLLYQNGKQQWLQQQGIKYLLMAAPNKQSIYPRYLMKHVMAVKGTSRFEQLLAHTNGQLPDYILNLHALLQPDKHKKPLYYKNDTHWNKLAAYIVFQEVFKNISAWFPGELFQTEFEFVHDETGVGGNTGKGGDLTRILMKENVNEIYPQIKRFRRCESYKAMPYQLTDIANTNSRRSFIRRCRTRNLKAIIFRDSFFVQLEPFFSENFKEVVYLWKSYDQKNVEEIMSHFKPDIVIEAIVERHIFDSLIPH